FPVLPPILARMLSPPQRVDVRFPRALRVLIVLSVAAMATLTPPLARAQSGVTSRAGAGGTIGTGGSGGTGDGKPAPAHVHTWAKQSRKEWVAPEKKTVQVGVDSKGKPIYETKIVKPGYWRTVAYFRCSCGATKS